MKPALLALAVLDLKEPAITRDDPDRAVSVVFLSIPIAANDAKDD
ncbi:hypothetical protein FDI24_gp169 [Acidovorax phage ACP17]|uniref:Uncharacterized protein n=1 Tax=Acidovorax phage ACP17 TaxID=2010329 RepID=A0A218M325_9CAUD|nr:hypothetical protein FDI24_gp169 [Acidovorax phage ACP17]ASD50451.1 hypothetical protein [Acidovorax phage ACP17]